MTNGNRAPHVRGAYRREAPRAWLAGIQVPGMTLQLSGRRAWHSSSAVRVKRTSRFERDLE